MFFYRGLPAVCSFSAYVCLRFIYIFFLGSFVWVYFGKPVYSFEAIVFMLCIVFGPLFPRIFACLCGPLLRFSAFAISAFPFCFLGSIVRLFLRLPV